MRSLIYFFELERLSCFIFGKTEDENGYRLFVECFDVWLLCITITNLNQSFGEMLTKLFVLIKIVIKTLLINIFLGVWQSVQS